MWPKFLQVKKLALDFRSLLPVPDQQHRRGRMRTLAAFFCSLAGKCGKKLTERPWRPK